MNTPHTTAIRQAAEAIADDLGYKTDGLFARLFADIITKHLAPLADAPIGPEGRNYCIKIESERDQALARLEQAGKLAERAERALAELASERAQALARAAAAEAERDAQLQAARDAVADGVRVGNEPGCSGSGGPMTTPHTTAIAKAAESICEQYNLSYAESHVAILIAQTIAPLLEQAPVHPLNALVIQQRDEALARAAAAGQALEQATIAHKAVASGLQQQRDTALAKLAACEAERNAVRDLLVSVKVHDPFLPASLWKKIEAETQARDNHLSKQEPAP